MQSELIVSNAPSISLSIVLSSSLSDKPLINLLIKMSIMPSSIPSLLLSLSLSYSLLLSTLPSVVPSTSLSTLPLDLLTLSPAKSLSIVLLLVPSLLTKKDYYLKKIMVVLISLN